MHLKIAYHNPVASGKIRRPNLFTDSVRCVWSFEVDLQVDSSVDGAAKHSRIGLARNATLRPDRPGTPGIDPAGALEIGLA